MMFQFIVATYAIMVIVVLYMCCKGLQFNLIDEKKRADRRIVVYVGDAVVFDVSDQSVVDDLNLYHGLDVKEDVIEIYLQSPLLP